MSKFLGKIHYWLYNKILWFEALESEIIKRAETMGFEVNTLAAEIGGRFGAPMGEEPLEEIIDTSNIHGWLQQRIESAELRQAALISGLLKQNSAFKIELLEIYTAQGEAAGRECRDDHAQPEEIFNKLNDFLLEGMPCDRVNEMVESNENEFCWETVRCLHMPYWNRAGGNVQDFYDLREVWIKAFVSAVNSGFKFEKTQEGLNRIVRK